MMPGQAKAMAAHYKRILERMPEDQSLALFYEEAFQVGQGILAQAMREAEERCPHCGGGQKRMFGKPIAKEFEV